MLKNKYSHLIFKKYTWWWETLIPSTSTYQVAAMPSTDLALVTEWTGQHGPWLAELTIRGGWGEESSNKTPWWVNPAYCFHRADDRQGQLGLAWFRRCRSCCSLHWLCGLSGSHVPVFFLILKTTSVTSWDDVKMDTVTIHFWFLSSRIFCLFLLDLLFLLCYSSNH